MQLILQLASTPDFSLIKSTAIFLIRQEYKRIVGKNQQRLFFLSIYNSECSQVWPSSVKTRLEEYSLEYTFWSLDALKNFIKKFSGDKAKAKARKTGQQGKTTIVTCQKKYERKIKSQEIFIMQKRMENLDFEELRYILMNRFMDRKKTNTKGR